HKDHDEAVRLNTKDPAVFNARGRTYLLQGDLDNAFANFNFAVKTDSTYADGYVSLGMVQLRKRSVQAAIEDFNMAIRYDDRSTDAYLGLGMAYLEKEDYDGAIDRLSRALLVSERFAEAYYYRGKAYIGKKQYGQAAQDLTRATEINGTRPAYFDAMADAHERLGDAGKARECRERARQLERGAGS